MTKLFFALLLAGCVACVSQLSKSQTASQYPVADKIADKVIQKYQTSSCEELKEQKKQPQSADAQKEQMQLKVIDQLKKDSDMRKHFLDKIAGPIANKMFECGMIP